ncbi:jg16822 [Pararge aegeria aegeria]|uniref:Jg16822 protein n=1 Tax=Pararge aegeria aegeria TaxID=348720 RepID=A0A8S4SBY9_9NEOP|nr:jg16822 [Pararge aegeria aegeria]
MLCSGGVLKGFGCRCNYSQLVNGTAPHSGSWCWVPQQSSLPLSPLSGVGWLAAAPHLLTNLPSGANSPHTPTAPEPAPLSKELADANATEKPKPIEPEPATDGKLEVLLSLSSHLPTFGMVFPFFSYRL